MSSTVAEPRPLDITFTFGLGNVRPGANRTCVQLRGSAAVIRPRRLVKLPGTADRHPFTGAFMALGDGTHKLPVAAAVRRAIGKDDGDEVDVHLLERLS